MRWAGPFGQTVASGRRAWEATWAPRVKGKRAAQGAGVHMKTIMLFATGVLLAFVCAFLAGWLGLPGWLGALIAIGLMASYLNFGRQ